MPRRIYEYPDVGDWGTWNLISTIGSFILGLGVLVTAINVVRSLQARRQGRAPTRGGPTRSSGSRPRRRPSTTSTSIPRVRSVEPMKDIRRSIERRTGADQPAETTAPAVRA